MFKKLVDFFGIALCAVGVIGGIGYACYSKAYFIAVCVAVLGVCAFPQIKEFVNDLMKYEAK